MSFWSCRMALEFFISAKILQKSFILDKTFSQYIYLSWMCLQFRGKPSHEYCWIFNLFFYFFGTTPTRRSMFTMDFTLQCNQQTCINISSCFVYCRISKQYFDAPLLDHRTRMFTRYLRADFLFLWCLEGQFPLLVRMEFKCYFISVFEFYLPPFLTSSHFIP